MFNRLKNGIFGESKTKALESMGFSLIQAREALSATNGDVNSAAELLLSQGSMSTPMQQQQQQQKTPVPTTTADDEDEQLRRVMEESVRIINSSSNGDSNIGIRNQSRPKHATEASIRAGQAAAQRAQTSSSRFGANGIKARKKTKPKPTTSTITSSSLSPSAAPSSSSHLCLKPKSTAALSIQHPNVKMPTQMKDKSKEEQIIRCTKRLSPHPLAVDTLIRSLTAIRANPSDPKYRKIDKNNAGYKRALQDVPGAHDLLLAVNFRPLSPTSASNGKNELIMHAADVDYALLYLATSALEKIKEDSVEYRDAKRLRQFCEEVRRIQTGLDISGEEENEEAIKRAALISKCPTEPLSGAGALLQLTLGDEIKLQRRFDGDDILKDVVHWIAGGCGSVIPEKLILREWCLVDLNRYPIAPIDVKANMDRTLQFLGCWPSGRLEVRPSNEDWRQGEISAGNEKMGSSRGLGAAPSSALG